MCGNRISIGSLSAIAAITLAVAPPQSLADPVRIVVAGKLPGDMEYECYTMDRDGANIVNVTSDFMGNCWRPTVSPDGTMLAFYDGTFIQIMDLASRTLLDPPLSPTSYYALGDWVDNDTVTYSAWHGGVRLMDIDGTNEYAIPGSPQAWAYLPRVSWDGTKIACGFANPYNAYSMNLYVHYLGIPGWVPLVTDGNRDSNPCWGQDDDIVYYQHEDVIPSVDSLRKVIESTAEITVLIPGMTGWFLMDAAPDADELLITRGNELRLRDLPTCNPEDPEYPLDCETPILTAELVSFAKYFVGTDVIETVTYDGDTLLSTEGYATTDANLIASLRGPDGEVLDIDNETVTFTLCAEGVEPIVVTAVSADGTSSAFVTVEPAIYAIDITLDSSDATGFGLLVVYNPEGGFATGGGWIVPPDDGLNTYPDIRGNFGFNAKYKQGNPTGHIEFRYSDGYINLNSDSIEQLVITGDRIAQFKGYASVNGEEGYWFFAKAVDNDDPGVGSDEFDIKIWGPGVDEDGDPTERISGFLQGGNIVVHAR